MKLFLGLFFLLAVFHSFAQTYTLEGNELVLPSPITFKTSSAELTKESEPALKHILSYLKDKSYISTLRIEGHNAASDSQKLTEQRALTVAHWLVHNGVDCTRLLAVGFGATKPIVANDTPEHRAQNNRIVVVNAALKGRLIGGMPADGGGKVSGDVCETK